MNASELFNCSRFGEALKAARKQAGYKSAQAFSDAVRDSSGLIISKDTIYKIEKGEQEPLLMQGLAFSLTLFGSTIDYGMVELLDGCICEKWRERNREAERADDERLDHYIHRMVRKTIQAEAFFKEQMIAAVADYDAVVKSSDTTDEEREAAALMQDKRMEWIREEYVNILQSDDPDDEDEEPYSDPGL